MMSPSKVKKIYGPPGTGKTTFLLNIVEQELEKKPDTRGYSLRSLHQESRKRGYKPCRL